MLFRTVIMGAGDGVALRPPVAETGAVWNQPYLETCCRAALHRLFLAGSAGRPPDRMDGPCLERLASMDLCKRDGARFVLTAQGRQRHATEVLKAKG